MTERRRPLRLCGGENPSFDAVWARYEALTPEERETLLNGTPEERARLVALLSGEVVAGMRVNVDGTRDLVSFSDPEFNEILRQVYEGTR